MSGSGMNGIPGANAMGDTLEFVKSLWGSMKIPGMAMPSMSPEDIDKQIADLKAVESWLQMNMNMLRGSIQALEVQSATLSALRSMSKNFAQAASGAVPADDKPAFDSPFMSTHPSEGEAATNGAGTPDPASMAAPFANPAAWWNVVQDQFQQAVNQAIGPVTRPATKRSRKAATKSSGKTASKSATSRKKPAAGPGK